MSILQPSAQLHQLSIRLSPHSCHSDDHFWCPWCADRGFRAPQGFVRRLPATDCDSAIDENMRAALLALQRCECVDSTCGGFRLVGQRTCNRCRQPTQCRPPVVGDIVAGAMSGHASNPAWLVIFLCKTHPRVRQLAHTRWTPLLCKSRSMFLPTS